MVIYQNGLPVHRQSPIQVVTTRPGVKPKIAIIQTGIYCTLASFAETYRVLYTRAQIVQSADFLSLSESTERSEAVMR